MRLDGLCEELKLAWEYNGKQHYAFVEFFHRSPDALQKQRERDERLRAECDRRGWILIEIPYWVKDKHTYIVSQLRLAGLFRLINT